MGFSLPQFNLKANIWHGFVPLGVLPTDPPVAGPDITDLDCQLYQPSRYNWVANPSPINAVADANAYTMILLRVPAGTDLRDPYNSTYADVVECPVGTGRYYVITYVDDQHKGFPNEYRFAGMCKAFQWPTPIP